MHLIVKVLSMKSRSVFLIIGTIHILIGLSLIGMIPNFDEAINTWITSEIPQDIKEVILGQTRVIIIHSTGTGIILLYCRSLKDIKDVKKVLIGYLFLMAMILTNIAYEIAIGVGGSHSGYNFVRFGGTSGMYRIFEHKSQKQ